VDIYLPGYVIGLGTTLLTRPRDEASALTSIAVEFIAGEEALAGSPGPAQAFNERRPRPALHASAIAAFG
jgi:hypothetical protein